MSEAVRVDRHDRMQLELKTSYTSSAAAEKKKVFDLELWFFLPEAAGIRPENYDAKRFYEDLKSYVRHQTPSMPLDGLASSDNSDSPLQRLEELRRELAVATGKQRNERMRELRREAKLVCCIFRKTLSELKDLVLEHLTGAEMRLQQGLQIVERMQGKAEKVLSSYRKTKTELIALSLNRKTLDCLDYIDETLSVQIDATFLAIMRQLKLHPETESRNANIEAIVGFISQEQSYRKDHNYKSAITELSDTEDQGEHLWNQLSMLKKYSSSVLYLRSTRNHFVDRIQDLLLGVAAGLAMIWAVGVQVIALYAFDVQLAPDVGEHVIFLFLAMAVSAYILKDRIKSWVGQGLSRRIPRWLYDRRFDLATEGEPIPVGSITETVRFVEEKQVPDELLRLRESEAENPLSLRIPCRVLHYRRRTRMNLKKAAKELPRMLGLSDILRINMWRWIRTLDATTKSVLFQNQSGEIHGKALPNTYQVDLLIRSQKQGKNYLPVIDYNRVVLNRRGIVRVER
jgi:hypothetical protein